MRWQSTVSAHAQLKPDDKTRVRTKFFSEHGRTLATFDEGGVVFAQGDPADSICYIQKGKVKLTVASKAGKEATIEVLEAGDLFGEGCLAGQHKRGAAATALSECSIIRLERDKAVQLLRTEPAFSELLLSHLLARTNRIEEYLTKSLSPPRRDSRQSKPAGGASV